MALRSLLPQFTNSIKKKLVLFTVIATFSTLLMAIIAIISIDRALTKRHMIDEMTALSQVIAARSEVALMFNDRRAIQSNLDALKNSPEYVLSCLYSQSHDLLGQIPKVSDTTTCPLAPPANMANFEPITSEFLHIWTPVLRNQNEAIGHLYLKRSLVALNYRLTQFSLASGIISVVVLIIGSIIIASLQKIISQPILDLSALSTKIASDNDFRPRATVTSQDEVGNLSKAFNTMLDTIEKTQKDLKFMAYNDALTGLPNRSYFRENLAGHLTSVQRSYHSIALLFIDLDGFKAVNDTIGHEAGDMVLTVVSERMQKILRKGDMVARLGGDEFTIIISDIVTPAALRKITLKLIATIEEPITFKGEKADVSASVGIAMAPADADSIDMLLKLADAAMYRAKAKGKKTFYFYNEAIDTEMKRASLQEKALKTSLLTESTHLLYQPILELSSSKTLGAAAILTSSAECFKAIKPQYSLSTIRHLWDETIANIMLTTMIEKITNDTSLLALPMKTLDEFELVLPVTSSQLRNLEMIPRLQNLIRQLEINGIALKLGVDQTGFENTINETLRKHIILSDDGNGLENLGSIGVIDHCCLATLPPNITDEWTIKAWHNLVNTAKEANASIIAVGVHKPDQLQFIQSLGIQIACGDSVSKSLSIQELLKWIETEQQRRST